MSVGPTPARIGRGFAARHRLNVVLLWAQIPVLAAVALLLGEPVTVVAISSVILVALGVAGMVVRSSWFSAFIVTLGLLTSSAVVMQHTGWHPNAVFHLVAMICAVSFYRRWLLLALAVAASSVYLLVSPLAATDSSALVPSGALVALALILAIAWRVDGDPEDKSDVPSDRFRTSFEEAPIGMAVLKPSGEFLDVNRSMGEILGYEQAALIGANITGLVHPDDQGDLGEAWEQIGNSSAHSAIEWMRCLKSTGRPIWTRMSLSLVPRTEEQPAMVILQLEDVTHSYDEQRRLEALLRGKDEFVAVVGDEIRQPLSLLIDLTTGEDARVDTLPSIGAHAKEIASIVDDLVVSARADSAAVSMMPHRVDVEELCRDVMARIPGTEDVSLHVVATELWGDPGLTRQIVNNLVLNALRFGGPEVSVRTIHSGPDTVIQVFDNGPEIPLEERERIFSGDLRTGEPVTRPAAVGLSLTVGRHLARMMEGDVVYRRTSNGENLFELRLPSEPISEIPRRRGVMQGSAIPA